MIIFLTFMAQNSIVSQMACQHELQVSPSEPAFQPKRNRLTQPEVAPFLQQLPYKEYGKAEMVDSKWEDQHSREVKHWNDGKCSPQIRR